MNIYTCITTCFIGFVVAVLFGVIIRSCTEYNIAYMRAGYPERATVVVPIYTLKKADE